MSWPEDGGAGWDILSRRSRGKIPCQCPNPRAKTWHKIWMTGLNPNYGKLPIPSPPNSLNKCQKSSFPYDRRRYLIVPFPPGHPPHFECTQLLLWSADWWRHNIADRTGNLNPQWMPVVKGWLCGLLERLLCILINYIIIYNENSINLSADSLQVPQIQIV